MTRVRPAGDVQTLGSLTTGQPEGPTATIAHYRSDHQLAAARNVDTNVGHHAQPRRPSRLHQRLRRRSRPLRRVVSAATPGTRTYGQDQVRLDTIHAKLQDELGAAHVTELTDRAKALTPDQIGDDTLELLCASPT